MKDYRPRIADRQLRDMLEAFGAVSIVGPKYCGKTTTAEQVAKSAVYMQDPDKKETYKLMAAVKPSQLLDGEKPRLIDEWQDETNIWDAVRFSVDKLSEEGLYILTGSVTIDESKIMHSGAGRISRMRMYTMSLFESGDSTGEVSLSEMFLGKEVSGISRLSLEDIAERITRGGWPNSVGKSPSVAHNQIKGYCETILGSEVKTADGVERDRDKMRLVLRSISRNISTSATDTTIVADLQKKNKGAVHINTLRSYEKALRKIHVIDDLPAWTPNLRSRTTIRVTDTRHLTDPAIAAYFLGASARDLMNDPRTFGLLFESLVIRDLRVYASSLGGEVLHYHDRNGLEADAIIHLHNGKWGAVEVKLGAGMIEDAANNLLKIKEKVESETMGSPSFLAVVTATEYAYTRKDGIHVVPIGCLKD
ncbi:MAG: DUF4143 domain-containing protein [Candidatus Methanoplasma sp.]|nr:DUF4143 domain-containing protein [Candidatus Methanoplasma sp.]